MRLLRARLRIRFAYLERAPHPRWNSFFVSPVRSFETRTMIFCADVSRQRVFY
jgi:hypothetical protein